MAESLQVISIGSEVPQDIVGKLDLSRHPELARQIVEYKRRENHDFGEPGRDIGLEAATVGFFMDNLGLLYDLWKSGELAYLFEDKRHGRVQERCRSRQILMLQCHMGEYALRKNKYFRSREQGFNIGDEAARIDFDSNRAENWGARLRPAYCAVICEKSPYCQRAHEEHFRVLEDSQGHI